MAAPTRWTWVWVRPRRWWRLRKPGELQSTGWQKVGCNLATEKQLKCGKVKCCCSQESNRFSQIQFFTQTIAVQEFKSSVWTTSHSQVGDQSNYWIVWKKEKNEAESFQSYYLERCCWWFEKWNSRILRDLPSPASMSEALFLSLHFHMTLLRT